MLDYLENFVIHCLEDNLHLVYAQAWKDGKKIEEYNSMPVKTRLNTWSISKGIVSAAVGIALEEGIIDLEEKLIDAYPEYRQNCKDPNMAKVKLRHLLTMTTGLKDPLFFCDGEGRYTTEDWVGYFFEHAELEHEPGEIFLYSNFNTYLLSTLIEIRTGKNLLEFLRKRLLEPMGMRNPDWTLCPKGHVHAANGLYFTIDELAAYGEFVRNKGAVDGKQLVPKAYMEEAMKPHVDLSKCSAGDDKANGYYGYKFWISKNQKMIHTDGNYGQFCRIYPEKKMTVVAMSLEGGTKMAKMNDYFWQDIDLRIMNE